MSNAFEFYILSSIPFFIIMIGCFLCNRSIEEDLEPEIRRPLLNL